MYSKQTKAKLEKTKSTFTSLAVCLLAALGLALVPQTSLAGDFDWMGSFSAFGLNFRFGSGGMGAPGSTGIAGALCTIVGWFEAGGVGAAIASMAVIFMGIAAFFGKVTWGMALTTACGIFAIFGSSEIIYAITGGMGDSCFS